MPPSRALSNVVISNILNDREDDTYCDLYLICGEQIIPVHKVIACPQSSVLEDANSNEPLDMYEIQDAEVTTTERMVEYLYTGEYTYDPVSVQREPETDDSDRTAIASKENNKGQCIPPTSRDSAFSGSSQRLDALGLLPHFKVFKLAKALDIEALAAKAIEYLNREIMGNAGSLKFLKAIPFLYSLDCELGASLKQKAVEATRSCFGPRMALGGRDRQLLEDAFKETPAFAKDVFNSCIIIDMSTDSGATPGQEHAGH